MNTTDTMTHAALAQQSWSRHHRTLPADLYTSDIDATLTVSGRLIEGIWMSFFNRRPYLIYDLADDAPDRCIRRRALRDLADRAGLPCVTIGWRENGESTEYALVPRNELGTEALQERGTMKRAELIAWLYGLRGAEQQDATERAEISGWRDDLATRFRSWEPEDLGFACAGEPVSVVALLELKQRDNIRFDDRSAQVEALYWLACAGKATLVAGGYQHRAAVPATEEAYGFTETWEFACADGPSQTERDFVAGLWQIRGTTAPNDLLARLAGPRQRVR